MNLKCVRAAASLLTALSLVLTAPASLWAQKRDRDNDDFPAKTPIKHVVVIYQENVSFDHYFATYPHAFNPTGQPEFHATDDTPRADNLLAGGLLDQNPNSVQPFRLDRSQNVTCDQNHNYANEQKAFNHGLMDKFPENVGVGATLPAPPAPQIPSCLDYGQGKGLVMGYYDGNTVTALWNYAQHFAMSDNSFSTVFGPSTPGALNLISGSTSGATALPKTPAGGTPGLSGNIAGGLTSGAVIGDPRPGFDECVVTNPKLQTTTMITLPDSSRNVGNLLNDKGITWGWFQGGFVRTGVDLQGRAICATHNVGFAGDDGVTTVGSYIPHHEPFMYYQSTANPHHNPPSNYNAIGKTDQANHQYDLSDFWIALGEGHLPAVSFLKAGAYQDGHAAYSSPLDEQIFLVNTINRLQQSDEWKEMAIIIAYDDSDGWYDHAMDPVVNQSSSTPDDFLSGPGACGVTAPAKVPGRCGYGPRQPFLVISPYAKTNYVDHRITDQSSILRFIEDNWDLGRIGGDSFDIKAGTLNGMFDFDDHDNRDHDKSDRKLFLDPSTGLKLDH